MSLWVCRLREFEKSPLPTLLDKNILSREYILEDIYKFTYSGELDEETLNLIDNIRLFNLWLFSSSTDLDMYHLGPLLKSMIKNFFGAEVDTFLIYNLNFTGLRIIPIDVNGNFIYSSWSKINYFTYYVRVDNLVDYKISNPGEKTYTLFGTDFVPKRQNSTGNLLSTSEGYSPPLQREDLPHPELVEEIRESFQLGQAPVNVTRGPFWTALDHDWLIEAWSRILLQQLPLITVYYSGEEDENLSLKLELLAHLAGARQVTSQNNSVSFILSSLPELESILERMQAEAPSMKQWLVLGTDDPEQTRLLQIAFEKKYPHAVAWAREGKIVVNLTEYSTPEFSDEELLSAQEESNPPQQHQPRREVVNVPPLLEHNGETKVKIGSKLYPIEYSYAELSPLWSDSILTPWALERYKQGKWTEQWFR